VKIQNQKKTGFTGSQKPVFRFWKNPGYPVFGFGKNWVGNPTGDAGATWWLLMLALSITLHYIHIKQLMLRTILHI